MLPLLARNWWSDGLISLVWLVGFWAVAFGIINLAFGIRLRTINSDATGGHEAAAAT